MKPFRTRSGRGFTLVEMLVVVTIIGILAAILIPTIAVVQRQAKNTAITVEMNQLSQALETYKQEHNDYPPDFTNVTAVANHVKRAYPRSTFRIDAWLRTPTNPPALQDPTRLDPAEALVFWLSLLKRNVRNPFTGSGEKQEYFTFKEEQLTDVDGDGWPEYTSKHTQGTPYVYFDGRVQNSGNGGGSVCSYAWAVYPSPWSPLYPAQGASLRLNFVGRNFSNYPIPVPAAGFEFGVARPYRSNVPVTANSDPFHFPSAISTPPSPLNATEWLEPKKFQIVCAGLDGLFGADYTTGGALVWKQFPKPNYYDSSSNGDFAEDFDNVANFGEKTIGASIP